MKKHITLLFATMLLALSCGNENNGKDPSRPDDNPDESLWRNDLYLPLGISVYTGNDLVESIDLDLDKFGRVISLVRKDVIQDKVLLDLEYSYSGTSDLYIKGKYFFTSGDKEVIASIDGKKGTVTYGGTWDKAWQFVSSFNEDGTVLSTEANLEFSPSTGQYSTVGGYNEVYSVSGGNIVTAVVGTNMESQSSKLTKSVSESELTIEYTYCDHEDNQNFGVFLMNCDLPVWVAKGLPGCRNLITGMKMKHGNITLPTSFTVEYAFDDNGDIETATRTDYNGTAAVLKRVYKFTY